MIRPGMRDLLAGPIVIAFVAATACGDSRPPANPPNPPPSGVETIRGNERLGWDQQAAGQAELATFSYAIYVDGTRSVLRDVTCTTTASAAGFPCSARLPSLTPGLHTLEVAAFLVAGGVTLESSRSTPLRVNVSASITGSTITGTSGDAALPLSARSPHVRVAASFDGFSDIGDVAVAPDGRVFVAERRGVVRVISDGVTDPRPVLVAGERLVSMALDPEFARTGLVYVLQADSFDQNARMLRLVRYRDAGGSFGERAVIIDNLPAAGEPPSGSVRVGPDGKLYVTSVFTPADRDVESEGRLLRMEKDGTTPADQPPGDPVYARGFAAIRGFDWEPGAASIWIADGPPGFDRLSTLTTDPQRARQRTSDAEHRLTAGTRALALRFYDGRAIPALRDTLLVAADTGLLSVRFAATSDPRESASRRDPRRIAAVETLIDAPMRAVATAADGVYVATDSSVFLLEKNGTSRLVPQSLRPPTK